MFIQKEMLKVLAKLDNSIDVNERRLRSFTLCCDDECHFGIVCCNVNGEARYNIDYHDNEDDSKRISCEALPLELSVALVKVLFKL